MVQSPADSMLTSDVRRYLWRSDRATTLQKPYVGRLGGQWVVYVPSCHRFGVLWWGQMRAETFAEALVRLDGLLLSHGYDVTTWTERRLPLA